MENQQEKGLESSSGWKTVGPCGGAGWGAGRNNGLEERGCLGGMLRTPYSEMGWCVLGAGEQQGGGTLQFKGKSIFKPELQNGKLGSNICMTKDSLFHQRTPGRVSLNNSC